jgi:hypothetical protein
MSSANEDDQIAVWDPKSRAVFTVFHEKKFTISRNTL